MFVLEIYVQALQPRAVGSCKLFVHVLSKTPSQVSISSVQMVAGPLHLHVVALTESHYLESNLALRRFALNNTCPIEGAADNFPCPGPEVDEETDSDDDFVEELLAGLAAGVP